jgi:hypothetical protein
MARQAGGLAGTCAFADNRRTPFAEQVGGGNPYSS